MNARQREVVLFDDGGALVLAGAGTGKTRVLTGRIVHLLNSERARPEHVLAVTFTNKAAKEMRARIETAMGHAPRGLMLGTFHGICHRILRVHAAGAGLARDFQILDAQDQLAFVRRLLRARGINDAEFPPHEVRNFIGAAKERGWRAGDVPTHDDQRMRRMAEIYALYETECRGENKVDFAELMLAVIELWRGNEELRGHYARRFRYVLVDEFQDTSRQQFEWLRMLDSGENDFFAVGDDDQSIYGFRGAEPAIMSEFQSKFRAPRLFRLEENYRSVRNILDAANQLISGNKNRLGKTLRTAAAAGAEIAVIPADNDELEATMVAQLLSHYLSQGGDADETAVLYRTNAQGRQLESALMSYGVPYRVFGGLRFYDRMEVKHALAYLRLMAGEGRDVDAILRVINVPPRGIGDKTVETLLAEGDVFAAVAGTRHRRVAEFWGLVRELRAVQGGLAVRARAALEVSGLLAHYEAKGETERVENLQELVSAAAQFEENFARGLEDGGEVGDEDALVAFLGAAALESGGEGAIGDERAASLMTVHAAKGLEFKRVFIVGMEEGLFPHGQSLGEGTEFALEEERRLLYVAITRAREELSLHFAHRRMLYGRVVCNPMSRFLRELPASCLVDNAWEKRSDAPFGGRRGGEEDGTRHARAMTMMTPAPPRIKSVGDGFRIGDAVRHAKYGTGVVLERHGSGADEQVKVFFKKAGSKSFKTALAKLEKV